MGQIQDTAQDACGNIIPRLGHLRRIPMCYRHILPLAPGVLTVAITDRQNTVLLEALSELTGYTIFPVWVNLSRMRLLIRRIERWEQRRNEILRWPDLVSSFQVHTIVAVLTAQMKEKMW